MGCVHSSVPTAPAPSPSLYTFFAERIAATKHDGTADGPDDSDKRYLRECSKKSLIAPEDEPSLLELAVFSPWFEYLLETKKCDPRVLYDDHGRQPTLRIKLLGHPHFHLLSQAVREWEKAEELGDGHRHGGRYRGDNQLTNEQWWDTLPDSSMRAKFKQPAEWDKFRKSAVLFGLTTLLGTPFPFPFPVVVIGSMIWAALYYMRDLSKKICPELVGMFERAQDTARSIVKRLHDQMEKSLASGEELTPLQSLEIDYARNLEADLKKHGETMGEILSSRESCATKITKVQEILDKLTSIQSKLLDRMYNHAAMEALNANTEASREATRAVKEATKMMSRLASSTSSVMDEDIKSGSTTWEF